MRCLCSGRSKSYIVTTVKTPSQTKISIGKVVSGQNGFDANASGVNGHASANTIPANDIETSNATTTEVQIHNGHNDGVTRYQDTSQIMAQELKSVSTSNISTPQGTIKKRTKAPQPMTLNSHVITNNNPESQVTYLNSSESQSTSNISGSTVTGQISSESHSITSNNLSENQITLSETTKGRMTPPKNVEIPVTTPEILGSEIVFQETLENELNNHNNISATQFNSHNNSESQMASLKDFEEQSTNSGVQVNIRKSSENLMLTSTSTPERHENYGDPSETSEIPITSPKTSGDKVIFQNTSERQLTHDSNVSEIQLISHNTSKNHKISPKTSINQTISDATSENDVTPTNTSENHISSHTISEIHLTTLETSSVIKSSHTAIKVTSEETANHTSSINDSLKTEANKEGEGFSSSTVTVSSKSETSNGETTTTYNSQTLPISKSEISLLSVPSPTNTLSHSSSMSSIVDLTASTAHMSLDSAENLDNITNGRKESVGELLAGSNRSSSSLEHEAPRRSGIQVSALTGPEITSEEEFPVFKKSPEDEEKIRKAIEKNEFLTKILSGKRLQDLISAMQPKNVMAKQKLVKQGEHGSEMFVSKEGSFKILIKGKVVGEFSDSRVFGELAILYNAKRLATIQAASTGKVWVLDRQVYKQIVLFSNLKEQDENLKFLQNVESLNDVDVEVLRQVSNLLKPEFFTSGTVIIRQGDKGDKFYIITAGTVTISKTGEGVLGKLGKGQCFGEMALQKEDTRQATVTAEAPGVECLTLTRGHFINHFGDVNIPQIDIRKTSFRVDAPSEYQDIKLEDLKIVKTLGVGGFGRVELVQHKKKKDLIFGLKYLKKIDIVYQNQQEHVYNEKLIQMNSRSPFIVRLYRTYKDNKYVYFLMESCLGGDLFSLLHRQKGKRFEEKDARFLSACVLEALEHLHSKGVVYRDLKPENLLIDKHGYLKLTDFGFAKKMPARGKTFTFAGTPEYVAPEIVLNRGHDKAVDYWAFGVFIFELLTGRTPFRTGDSSHMRTYNKILNGIDNVNFPTYMNPKARNLIEKLCRPVPAERMGMQKGGTRDIKAHKWYQGFEWMRFQQCQIPSPFRPKLRDLTDTSHFDLFKQDKDYPPDETSGWDIHF